MSKPKKGLELLPWCQSRCWFAQEIFIIFQSNPNVFGAFTIVQAGFCLFSILCYKRIGKLFQRKRKLSQIHNRKLKYSNFFSKKWKKIVKLKTPLRNLNAGSPKGYSKHWKATQHFLLEFLWFYKCRCWFTEDLIISTPLTGCIES